MAPSNIYKRVSLSLVEESQSSWILLAIALMVNHELRTLASQVLGEPIYIYVYFSLLFLFVRCCFCIVMIWVTCSIQTPFRASCSYTSHIHHFHYFKLWCVSLSSHIVASILSSWLTRGEILLWCIEVIIFHSFTYVI